MASRGPRRALRAPPRNTRAQPAISYAEQSEDDDHAFDLEEASSTNALTESPPTPRPRRNAKKRSRLSSSHDSNHAHVFKRRKQPNSNAKQSQSQEMYQPSGLIPAWKDLPYSILVQIFRYASYPLYNDRSFHPLDSGRWLLQVARLCKAFAEPAFTVLYNSPPLVPMNKAHMLVDLLQEDPTKLTFRYRSKVESLQIEVGQVAAYTLPGSGHLDIFSFVKHLPRLMDLEFYHEKDISPYRNLEGTIKWTYPESLFEALDYVESDADPTRGDKTSICRLNSWRWSSRLAGKKYPIERIKEIHLKPSFLSLKKIAFVNYQVPTVKKGEEPPQHEAILAEALAVLPELRQLIFESSTLVNGTLLPLLPKNLKTFEIINCWEITADDLGCFLLTHGYNLLSLILNHNVSLSLSFLPSLGRACPKLEVLRMNLTYFNVHSSYSDSKPEYDKLLFADEIPDWPTTLQTIELIQLRQWETDAAEMFFQSFLDSAATLPNLRKLKLNTILNIGWRDRASFRDKWIGSLNRVFKRVSEPPLPVYSLRQDPDVIEIPSPPKRAKDDTSESTRKKSCRLSSGSIIADEIDELTQEDAMIQRRQARSAPSSATGTSVPSGSLTIRSQVHRKMPQEEDATGSTQRSTRTSTHKLPVVTYAEESPDSSETEEADYETSSERGQQRPRQRRISREVKILRETAGELHGILPENPTATAFDNEDSDDEPLVLKPRGKGKAKEFIHGMCEIVEVRIDNLRPAEIQVTEADFLDEEEPGDADWNGNDEFMDDGAAW